MTHVLFFFDRTICVVWLHPHTQWLYRGNCGFAVRLAGWLHLTWSPS